MIILNKTLAAFIAAVACSLLLFTACTLGDTTVSERLDRAEQSMADGDESSSKALCEQIVKNTDGFTVSDFGRLSILYMKLHEAEDDSDADMLDKATACYREAFAIDADSAAAFYSEVPVGDVAYVMLLTRIVGALDAPEDDFFSPADSLFTDSIPS